MPDKPAMTRLERMDAEHRQLSRAIQDLRALARGATPANGLSVWRDEMQQSLRSFKSIVHEHFEHEEEGGFLRDVLREVPNSQREVRGLRREHKDIEKTLDDVLLDLGKLESTADTERINQRIEAVTLRLVNHETNEQHLVQRAYYREYGAGD